MEDWLTQLATTAPLMPYVVVFGILILSGFGLPLPEDIPLIIGGYLCGTGLADPAIMLPGAMICILGADSLLYLFGRRWGHHIPRWPIIRRFLHPRRIRWAERKLLAHGGKFIFTARFLPGVRTPCFFATGVFRVRYRRFIFFDGLAALLSVPLIFGLAWYFANEIDQARRWIENAEAWTVVGLLLLVLVLVLAKNVFRKRVLQSNGRTRAAAEAPSADDMMG